MFTKFCVGAVAIASSFAVTSSAFAAFWDCPPVPEFDGSSAVAVFALLASVGAVLKRRAEK
ncbi:hypothetical protein [Hyphomicrobium sp.]|uniref:hypothetical protein n=1 Tax=Hyphomicrobium sp. TaxID=82 RepID=UPI0025B8FEEC|nr:hypothetical protein [Hyphomicrobium sp.]MCC7250769.1 hypothetical protein [Hyphomicrobium sp.]